MTRPTTRSTIVAAALAAGAVLAATGAGVGYAAAAGSSSTSVKACVSSKGRLALQSSSGRCAKGFRAVSINRQGPKGATGAKGATGEKGPKGDTGATGPGARKLTVSSSGSGTTPTVKVGSFGYSATCDNSVSGGTTSTYVEVQITAPAGVTASVSTVYDSTTGGSTTPTTRTYRTTFTGSTSFHAASTDGLQQVWVDAMRVVGSDGTVALLSADLTADSRATPDGARCAVHALVIPSS